MHIAVIGLGRMGAFHARTLHEHPEVERLTLVDRNEDTASALARELEATALTSMEEAISAGIDAVVIATSTDSHATLVETGIEAGIPVFCEKPIALDLETTDRIAEKVRNLGVSVQIGFHRRFDPGYRRAREQVQKGALGRIYHVRAIIHDPAPPHESYIAAAGGVFRDMHIHEFDIIPWVTGQRFVQIYADGSVLVDDTFKSYDDVDTSAALFRLADGALGTISGSRHDPLGYDVRMELYGSRDSIAIGWDDRTPLRSVEPDYDPPTGVYYGSFLDRFNRAFRAELAEFLRVARGEVESPSTMEESQQSLRVAIAAEMSRRERRHVAIASVG